MYCGRVIKPSTRGYFPSSWPGEDGGARRRQVPVGATLSDTPYELTASRFAPLSTMVVQRGDEEFYLLCHTGGDDAVSWVEQIHPETLEVLRRSVDLPAGPTWPGGVAVHANGSLYVTFGKFVHRLLSDLTLVQSLELPRHRPYNSLVITDDGTLIMKDFGGLRPGDTEADTAADCEICAIDPETLLVLDTLTLSEASVARLSAEANAIYVVGTTSLWRVNWSPKGRRLTLDDSFHPRYLLAEGEGFGWDAVVVDGAAWFLNNGAGSQHYHGSLLGVGEANAPQCVIRVDLTSGEVARFEINNQDHAVVANPPAVDVQRGIVIGYDSGNGVVTAWNYRRGERLWSRTLNHGGHPLLFEETGRVVLGDFDATRGEEDLVSLDVATGEEIWRCPTGSTLQSVLFHAPGLGESIFYCSFTTISRLGPSTSK